MPQRGASIFYNFAVSQAILAVPPPAKQSQLSNPSCAPRSRTIRISNPGCSPPRRLLTSRNLLYAEVQFYDEAQALWA